MLRIVKLLQISETVQQEKWLMSVQKLNVEKTYSYIQSLVEKIVRRKLDDDEEGKSGNIVWEADDPIRISKTLVRIPPPPIAQPVKERKSRFEDPDNTLDNSWDS